MLTRYNICNVEDEEVQEACPRSRHDLQIRAGFLHLSSSSDQAVPRLEVEIAVRTLLLPWSFTITVITFAFLYDKNYVYFFLALHEDR